jgi:trimeric autotransporter adhesin
VSASYSGVTGSTTVTVTQATITTISVSPVTASLTAGGEQQFSAQAIYSDNTQADVTQGATWLSSDATVVGVSDAGGPGGGKGLATALAAGTATVSAAYGGVTGSAQVTVSSATLVQVQVTPTAPSVAAGSSVSFAATAIYSDNTSRSVTAQATWTSSDTTVAQVSTAGATRGRADAFTSGSTTINATFGGVTGSTTLQVTAATLSQIQITPFAPTLLIGVDVRLVATGIYSDSTTVDLTASVSWTSSDASVVSVSNAAGTRGQASPLLAGGATVSATYQGVTGQDSVTVSPATIASIAVAPLSATITAHGTQAFTATALLSDGTSLDVTTSVTWLSSTNSIASISNAAGSQGVATGLATGSVTISAVRGSVSGTATLAVQ